jgi:hypothetical protein
MTPSRAQAQFEEFRRSQIGGSLNVLPHRDLGAPV